MAAMSAVPAVVQGVQGVIQSRKARQMLDGLERPTYEIPQSVLQGTQRMVNAASSFQMPGQDAYQQSIDQASSNALYNINQNATSGPEALAAMAGVYGSQMGAQNQMALAAAQDYQQRNAMASQALMNKGAYEDKQWMTNEYQPYAEEAQAASALAEAGKINAYQAVKGLAGVGANALMMKSLGMFDNGTVDTQQGSPAANKTMVSEDFRRQLNPNLQGFNKYGQPQFNNSVSRYSSFVPNMGITSKPKPFVPMMGDANVISNTGENTGIMFNNIPGVTDGLTESPLINQQPFNNVVSQITGRNSFTVGTTNSGGVGALNVTPPVVSNTAPVQPMAMPTPAQVQPTAVIPSQPAPAASAPAPAVPAPAIVSPGFAQAQQTMNAVEVGAIPEGTYTKDQMQAQDVAAAAAAPSAEPVVAPEATAPAVPPAPEIKKMTPLEATSLMVSRLPASIIKSSPSLQKFAEQASTEPENGEVTMTYKSTELLGNMPGQTRRWEPYTKEVPLPMVNGVVDWRAAVNNYNNSEDCKAGKCYSSTSAHSPAWFAIPMLGDLIDQEGYFKDIDDLNEKRGTSLSPKDQKNAIEFLFKEDLSEDEKKWLEMATHPKGSLQGVKNQMKPKLKALKEEYPDLYADIVDDEGNYIGGNK